MSQNNNNIDIQQRQLPQGWISVYDQEYEQNFYVNTVTNQSQWEFPVTAATSTTPEPAIPQQSKGVLRSGTAVVAAVGSAIGAFLMGSISDDRRDSRRRRRRRRRNHNNLFISGAFGPAFGPACGPPFGGPPGGPSGGFCC